MDQLDTDIATPTPTSDDIAPYTLADAESIRNDRAAHVGATGALIRREAFRTRARADMARGRVLRIDYADNPRMPSETISFQMSAAAIGVACYLSLIHALAQPGKAGVLSMHAWRHVGALPVEERKENTQHSAALRIDRIVTVSLQVTPEEILDQLVEKLGPRDQYLFSRFDITPKGLVPFRGEP